MEDKPQDEPVEEPVVNEYEFDLDKLKDVKHNWIKRGIVVSCEGANHPSHRHFLTKKREITPES